MSALQITEWPPLPTHEVVRRLIEDGFNLTEIAEICRSTVSVVRDAIWAQPENPTTRRH